MTEMGESQMRRPTRTLTLALLTVLLAAGGAGAAQTPGQLCGKAVATALRTCVIAAGKQQQQCYRGTGSACAPSDAKLLKALARTSDKVLARCTDAGTVQAAGFGALLTPAALVARIQNACTTAVAGLAARSYGGPHAAVRNAAAPVDQACLDEAWRQGQSLINYQLRQQSTCIAKVAAGKPCDTAKLAAKLAAREAKTATKIGGKCPNPLAGLVTVDPTAFVGRAAAQARCLVASAHPSTAPLTLDCGPRAAIPVPARGVNTQVVLPFATWGSRCGDGSNYAFQMRLAPAGQPVERVVVFMQGGGVCFDGPGCAGTSANLFEALNDGMVTGGIMSSTAATNPFRDWTKVYLPYCTQDLHIGGGTTTVYPQITVHRHGGLNVRAAMQYVRDVIWAELDATDPLGYRADRPLTVFTGGSAGGYGAAYNYHWMLDDLGWVRTTAVPDAALAMDNGTIGVIALGTITLPATSPGWNLLPLMPPYCATAACAEILDNLNVATAARLLGQPEQQILTVSNQIDTVQRNTTLFANDAAFVNRARTNYCATQNTPGLRYFLRADSTSIHGQVANSTHWNGAVVDGTTLRDWVAGAMSTPAAVPDLVAEGTLVADFPGVLAFPCAVD